MNEHANAKSMATPPAKVPDVEPWIELSEAATNEEAEQTVWDCIQQLQRRVEAVERRGK